MKVKKLKNLGNKIGSTGWKLSSLNAPGTETPFCHPVMVNSFFPFSASLLWGNKNWPPRVEVKKFENLGNKIGFTNCKWSSLNAQGTEILVSHSEWENSILPFSALGNKNWPPIMKVKKLKNLGNKIGSTGWKLSSLNAPGTETPFCHPVMVNSFLPFSASLSLWGNKNWPPMLKVKKFENLGDKIGFTGCKWSSLNAPGTEILVSDSECQKSIFPFSALCNKNLPPLWKWKGWKIWRKKLAQQAANGQVWMPQALKSLYLTQNGRIPFSHFQPWVIRIGLPSWKWKSWKVRGTKLAQQAANCPVWMPQVLKPCGFIQLGLLERIPFCLFSSVRPVRLIRS